VESRWFTGAADVPTFQSAELLATKIRALYQRKKGRDLFDLWLALTEMNLHPRDIIDSFAPYRPAGLTATVLDRNLRAKLVDPRVPDRPRPAGRRRAGRLHHRCRRRPRHRQDPPLAVARVATTEPHSNLLARDATRHRVPGLTTPCVVKMWSRSPTWEWKWRRPGC